MFSSHWVGCIIPVFWGPDSKAVISTGLQFIYIMGTGTSVMAVDFNKAYKVITTLIR